MRPVFFLFDHHPVILTMTTALDSTTSSPAHRDSLPPKLRLELWKRIDRRLTRGDILITNEQFVRAMVQDFRKVLQVKPDRYAIEEMVEMVQTVNETRPETYLTMGIKNAITKFFRETEERTQGQADAQEQMHARIKEMISEGNTALFLESIGVEVDDAALNPQIESAIVRIIDGKKLKAAPRRASRSGAHRRRASSEMGSVRSAVEEAAANDGSERPAVAPPPTDEEQAQYLTEEKKRVEVTANAELERAPRYLDSYVKQDMLSEKEAVDLRTLYGIDERLAKGEIDEAEANRLRNELSEGVRDKLQERLQAAVDHSVHYLNVFEALGRLPQERDGALEFLIDFADLVATEDKDVELAAVTKALEEDDELVENLGVLMERKDHGIRMLVANMPPFRHVCGPGEKIGTWVIEAQFVKDLRNLSLDEVSAKLNADDTATQVRAAADIKCMVALLNLLMRPTAMHVEIRRLRIHLRIRRTLEGGADERDGRNKVQQFLKRRLHNLYPDLTREERAGIEEWSNNLLAGRGEAEEEGEDRSKRVYRV